ncbi:YggT family protein [Castellaniella sp.]|uniref:YggT family protein n=1 Tax=Castellaniella sp. TaxID=1955812 RepID=UPI002AFE3E19|nr:YggT family protein [Castellaniella sp.]
MVRDILIFLLDIVFSLFGIVLILRAWIFAIRLHPFNPYSQAVLRATDWLVLPIRRVIPVSGRFDWPSILACWITAILYLLLTWLIGMGGALPPASAIGGLLLSGLLVGLKWLFNVIVWVTLIQAVLSWVNPLSPVMPVLFTLTAPLLDPIRRILPRMGGLDLSPLVLLVIAQIVMMILNHLAFTAFGL